MTYRVRNPELHQEEDVVPPWKVLLAAFVTLAIAAVLVVWAVSASRAHELAFRPSGAFPEQHLGPRHMVARVREDLFGEQRGASFNAQQREVLESWGWVDPAQGVVRVPIDRAIDLVVSGRQP
jgi:hypothetical protein